MSDTVIVDIDSIAAGGAGVGRVGGMAVFVPRTAPGDRVEVSLRLHKRYAEGRLLRVVAPSATRVGAACHHYDRDRCGGCQLQHLAYTAQLEAKRNVVQQALRRIGRREVAIDDIRASPLEWRYRNKLTLTLRQVHGRWRGGLRAYDAPDEVFQLEDCPITSDRVLAGWREVFAAAADLPEANELRGMVRAAGAGLACTLSGGMRWTRAAGFAARCPSLSAILCEDAAGGTHVVRDELAPDATLSSFEQVNPGVAEALHDDVAAIVERAEPRRVIDAYGGRGATAGRIRAPGREIVLIELDAEATRLAGRALGSQIQVVTGRVEHELPRALPADAVILNPPRAGVDPLVCRALEHALPRPSLVVYVSCDAATLARDVGRLPSYRIASMTLFDMFPQTAHVETVCTLMAGAA
ncbi:MAG: class I SAM-dependent RNA methyltransferase [Gemmatimonadaceae bacterium]